MPKSVAWFERLSYAAIALSVASGTLNWATIEKYYRQHPHLYPAGLVIAILVQVFWVWLVARRHRDWTRWATLVFVTLSLLQGMADLHQRLQLGIGAAVAFYGINLLFTFAAGLLFMPDAASWFKQSKR